MRPCRMLTDEECVKLATELEVPLALVKWYMQDPMYCPWHEEQVDTIEQLIAKAKGDEWWRETTAEELAEAEAEMKRRQNDSFYLPEFGGPKV